MLESGKLYVIAAPSGTGKTSLVKALIESTSNITVSISHTTRPSRPGEIHGKNYYFIEKTEFEHMIYKGEFLEHANVFNHFYGTSRQWVETTLANGLDVILEIDWQGCQQIQRLFPDCVSIFILPPSLNSLSERLIARNQDTPQIIRQRLTDTCETASHIHEFDYLIINDDFTTALNDLKTIVLANRLLEPRQSKKYAALLKEFQIR